jgi:hypothetical protein
MLCELNFDSLLLATYANSPCYTDASETYKQLLLMFWDFPKHTFCVSKDLYLFVSNIEVFLI